MTRFAFRFAVVPLAILIALPAGLDAEPGADARQGKGKGNGGGNFKTVSRTFANPGAIAIPAAGTSGTAGPYPAVIRVGGLKKGKLRDVDVTLRGFDHEHGDDADVLLVAPGGRSAVVMSDGGGPESRNLTLTLDDEAAAPLPSGLLVSGAYRPNNYQRGVDVDAFPLPAPAPSGAVALSAFDGIDPRGTWSLFVVDDVGGGTGSIANGWELTITAKVEKGDKGKGRGNAKGKGKGDGKGKDRGKGRGEGKGRGHDRGKGRGRGNGHGHGNG